VHRGRVPVVGQEPVLSDPEPRGLAGRVCFEILIGDADLLLLRDPFAQEHPFRLPDRRGATLGAKVRLVEVRGELAVARTTPDVLEEGVEKRLDQRVGDGELVPPDKLIGERILEAALGHFLPVLLQVAAHGRAQLRCGGHFAAGDRAGELVINLGELHTLDGRHAELEMRLVRVILVLGLQCDRVGFPGAGTGECLTNAGLQALVVEGELDAGTLLPDQRSPARIQLLHICGNDRLGPLHLLNRHMAGVGAADLEELPLELLVGHRVDRFLELDVAILLELDGRFDFVGNAETEVGTALKIHIHQRGPADRNDAPFLHRRAVDFLGDSLKCLLLDRLAIELLDQIQRDLAFAKSPELRLRAELLVGLSEMGLEFGVADLDICLLRNIRQRRYGKFHGRSCLRRCPFVVPRGRP
jgi:hypothetical protein